MKVSCSEILSRLGDLCVFNTFLVFASQGLRSLPGSTSDRHLGSQISTHSQLLSTMKKRGFEKTVRKGESVGFPQCFLPNQVQK